MLHTANTRSSFFLFRTFTECFHSLCPEKPWVTRLSSAGLVYLHFGRQLLAHLTQRKEDDRQLEVLYDKVRKKDDEFIADSGLPLIVFYSHTHTFYRKQIFSIASFVSQCYLICHTHLNRVNFHMELGDEVKRKDLSRYNMNENWCEEKVCEPCGITRVPALMCHKIYIIKV